MKRTAEQMAAVKQLMEAKEFLSRETLLNLKSAGLISGSQAVSLFILYGIKRAHETGKPFFYSVTKMAELFNLTARTLRKAAGMEWFVREGENGGRRRNWRLVELNDPCQNMTMVSEDPCPDTGRVNPCQDSSADPCPDSSAHPCQDMTPDPCQNTGSPTRDKESMERDYIKEEEVKGKTASSSFSGSSLETEEKKRLEGEKKNSTAATNSGMGSPCLNVPPEPTPELRPAPLPEPTTSTRRDVLKGLGKTDKDFLRTINTETSDGLFRFITWVEMRLGLSTSSDEQKDRDYCSMMLFKMPNLYRFDHQIKRMVLWYFQNVGSPPAKSDLYITQISKRIEAYFYEGFRDKDYRRNPYAVADKHWRVGKKKEKVERGREQKTWRIRAETREREAKARLTPVLRRLQETLPQPEKKTGKEGYEYLKKVLEETSRQCGKNFTIEADDEKHAIDTIFKFMKELAAIKRTPQRPFWNRWMSLIGNAILRTDLSGETLILYSTFAEILENVRNRGIQT